MAKKAVYLDDRERDLARRICDWMCLKAKAELSGTHQLHISRPALGWFHDEIQALKSRFEEPSGG